MVYIEIFRQENTTTAQPGKQTSSCFPGFTFDTQNRNRIEINYPGVGNYSQFAFDGLGRNVKIVEVSGGTTTSTKQLVWNAHKSPRPFEVRDGSSNVISQFFSEGESISGTNYYYFRDHLGSVREMMNGSGTIQAQYNYGPYGEVSILQGLVPSNFQYAGYNIHLPSGFNLTVFRAYSSKLGRWISRDPIEEDGGINLYEFVFNDPFNNIDLFGEEVVSDGTDGYPKGSIYHADGKVTLRSGREIQPSDSHCNGPCPPNVIETMKERARKRNENFRKAQEEEESDKQKKCEEKKVKPKKKKKGKGKA